MHEERRAKLERLDERSYSQLNDLTNRIFNIGAIDKILPSTVRRYFAIDMVFFPVCLWGAAEVED
jgi:hypothetical protein